ncbi:MAG: restriction endonuclease subunit S [Roseomonas sp.]|nr:restriction endonuclease subunit S [Roseomonas sp.]MCA3431169.1 restriction endonuclease subunit S [Roseomonas sp.]MCA3435103.1 restriction endonuclease subunit S [Roseomonas sp.]
MIDELPPGWASARLGDLVEPIEVADPTRTPDAVFRYIDIGSIDNEALRIGEPKTFSGKDAPSRARRVIRDGDVLFSTVRPYLRNIALASVAHSGCLTSTGISVLRAKPSVLPGYLFRLVSSNAFVEEVGRSMDGTLYPAVRDSDVLAASIPLPPLAEQRRIVERIEALFARTRRARADLERIAPLAKRYRERVLAKAFDTDAPRVRIDAVAELAAGYAFPKEWQGKTRGDYPFAKVRDISLAVAEADGILNRANNYLDTADLTTLRARPVPAGATVFAKIGEGLRLNRRAITSRSLIIDNNCMALVPKARAVLATYLHRFMLTVDLSPLAVATSVPSVRASDIAALEIPVPTPDEQAAAVRTIDKAQGTAKTVEREAVRALALLDRLEQSILTRAFRGELVPQDPHDEPAKVELERLRSTPATAGRGRSRKQTMPATNASVAPSMKGPAVPKNRADADVKGQPYLANHLRQIGSTATAEDLYKAADLSIADFYKQLSEEVAKGWVKDASGKLEAA